MRKAVTVILPIQILSTCEISVGFLVGESDVYPKNFIGQTPLYACVNQQQICVSSVPVFKLQMLTKKLLKFCKHKKATQIFENV